ncbi:hypothetical protein PF011_g1434 [Phytophthora fragariae]|uniref:Uncharacterized protein n=1 Tax=Phytophthora fragariae TaxID=53985 RepID=A0A6A3M9D4_9STRA|nr:hypothetical protein PF011_g1434 [Phytophthora fragariae]
MGRSKTKKKNGAGAKLSDGKGLATRLEEVESRSSQILRAQAPAQQGDVLLKDVLRGNGEKHLYDKILKLAVHADDDPPLIFGWKFVHEFVQAIHDANNQAAGGGAAVPPCPFPLPDPLTRESLLASVDAPYLDPIPNDVVGNDLWNSEEEPCVSDSKRIALLYDRGYQRED